MGGEDGGEIEILSACQRAVWCAFLMLTCIDLFAGAGGFTLAAMQSGYAVKVAVESDSNAVATYKRAFGNDQLGPYVFSEDIRNISPRAVKKKYFSVEPCDLILGGPPCQGFSTHRIKGAGIEDERNELVLRYFDFVRAMKPMAFLMENVPGMLWPRHASYLNRFMEQASAAGYDVREPVVIDARDFGVPQRRKRVFVLGTHKSVVMRSLIWPPRPSHGSPAARTQDPILLPWNDCSSAFRPGEPGDPNDVHMNHSDELKRAFAATPLNGGSRRQSGRMLPCHNGHDGHSDVYGRIDPRDPAPTMTTACINPSKGRFVHPTLNHGITARQAARIQTFPDDFVFEGGLMAAGKQIGNAVPVELAKALLTHIAPSLEAHRKLATEHR
ncbi:DNA cytosine methyltransferase [Mesorhizobium huakuii]|uniref:Cytosine-specific methyltransferase n=1 Tax=Mesorhizobium huakuii TaxID=28104 RepID=A0ABZ0VP14_9HYPH|nr:DNA cytosine methyltransferase [Mesorhizobium huakuii]WQB98667.1 DNA cytosine methyltransferase [Mesorhizobium huakuii]